MSTEQPIVNRVDQSGLLTLDLENYYHPGQRVVLDIKDQLFQGLILREKDFRAWIKSTDWQQYQGQNVAVTCTAEAIVPTWAYMLIAAKLAGVAHKVVFGNAEALEQALFQEAMQNIDPAQFQGAKLVIKGCSNKQVPINAYMQLTTMLQPVAASIMYGEPCSTVPIYKKPKPRPQA